MNQQDRLQQAAEALASVSGQAPVQAKRVLSEYDTRDLIASVAAEGAGGGAGGLSVMGPFAVPFNDPGVNNTYTVLTPIDAGTTVIRVWAINDGWLNSPETSLMEVTVDLQDQAAEELTEVYRISNFDPGTQDVSLELKEAATSMNEWIPIARVAQVPAAADDYELAAYIFVNSADTPSAGAINFYALVQA